MPRKLRRLRIRIQRKADRRTGTPASVLSEVKAHRMDTSVALDTVTGAPIFHEKRRYQVARDRKYSRAGIRDDGIIGLTLFGGPMFGGGTTAAGTVVHGSYAAPSREVVDIDSGEVLTITGRTEDPRRRYSMIHVERDGS